MKFNEIQDPLPLPIPQQIWHILDFKLCLNNIKMQLRCANRPQCNWTSSQPVLNVFYSIRKTHTTNMNIFRIPATFHRGPLRYLPTTCQRKREAHETQWHSMKFKEHTICWTDCFGFLLKNVLPPERWPHTPPPQNTQTTKYKTSKYRTYGELQCHISGYIRK